MGLFSGLTGNRRVEPHNLRASDAAQLEALAGRGADIAAPRESEFFLCFRSDVGAKGAADALRSRRVASELVEPSHDVPEWMVFVRGRRPLIPDFLRETVDLCESLAETYKGEYEGWAALLTPAERDAVDPGWRDEVL